MQDSFDLAKTFEQYPNHRREDLIPLLQSVQDARGYLSEDIISAVGNYLGISINKIYGVATFYDNFRFGPVGRYHIRVCHGTACHVGRAETLIRELEKLLKIANGETDKEGLFSLEVVSCLGACGLSPLIEVNQAYYSHMNPEKLRELLESFREEENIQS